MKDTAVSINEFQEIVRDFYVLHGRDLPWRQREADGSYDPYKILVSELMLQQTQVPRVIPKYLEFLVSFPTLEKLAAAELGEVLRAWSGLGYNRRAKFLHHTAKIVQAKGQFPKTLNTLTELPGIGNNTAGAILAYGFNQPSLFIETNIRTAYIHHFFKDQTSVSDKEILQLLTTTIDKKSPREFYWALMDYGTHLKAKVGNMTRNSKHYAKQSTFVGSKRQIRGQVIRLLTQADYTQQQLNEQIKDDRLDAVLADLQHEGLIQLKPDTTISLS